MIPVCPGAVQKEEREPLNSKSGVVGGMTQKQPEEILLGYQHGNMTVRI